MTNENIKGIVTDIIRNTINSRERARRVIASIDERHNGILVYLSHGATLGEAIDIQAEIKYQGLSIPEQMGNALIYVTE